MTQSKTICSQALPEADYARLLPDLEPIPMPLDGRSTNPAVT